ncbi:FRG domain-containing protein [Pantoea sp. A4]|uniref:FRG domain-containing protein n=1 Tax=Pantoea sp. A4 TaxID=1225184 RepID=UPI00036358C9|nr:FRG domain-containing protein [Pantoea sp. A4]
MTAKTVIDCKTAEDFLNEITPWTSKQNLSDFVFRGHSDSNYKLLPSAFRDKSHGNISSISKIEPNKKHKNIDALNKVGFGNLAQQHASYEFNILRRFYKKANVHGLYVPRSKFMSHSLERDYVSFEALMRLYGYDCWLDRDLIEVASIAQHYGLPTRLIDWTYNPYTAAFFASNSPSLKKDGNICLWMLNTRILTDVFDLKSSDVKIYSPLYQWNENAKSQSGVFTYKVTSMSKDDVALRHEFLSRITEESEIPTDEKYKSVYTDYETLDESITRLVDEYNHLKENQVSNNALIKITLPSSEAQKLNKHLRSINISEGFIYPGYSGVVREILNKNSLK